MVAITQVTVSLLPRNVLISSALHSHGRHLVEVTLGAAQPVVGRGPRGNERLSTGLTEVSAPVRAVCELEPTVLDDVGAAELTPPWAHCIPAATVGYSHPWPPPWIPVLQKLRLSAIII